MDKKKAEQVVLVVLIPIFLFSLIYLRLRNTSSKISHDGIIIEETEADRMLERIPKPDGALNITYKEGPRDPLDNLLAEYIYKLMEDGSGFASGDKLPLPVLRIEGLVWNTSMPQAIVNGKVVKMGDVIEGVKIVKIDKEGILIEFHGENVFIPKK